MDALDVLRLIVADHNRWMDAEMDKLATEHAALAALILPRLPAVLPTDPRGHDEAHRRQAALMREEERLALQRAGMPRRRPHTGSQLAKGVRKTP